MLDTNELLDDADITAALQPPSASKGRRGAKGSKAAAAAGQAAVTPEKQAASELLAHADSLSARERNKLKRKAKALERQGSLRPGQAGDTRGRVSGGVHNVVCLVQHHMLQA